MESSSLINMEITVSDPTKTGDGLSAYVRYKVITKSDHSTFQSKESIVYRRYTDFVTLFDYLTSKYKPLGVMVVKPPEKSIAAMAKVKTSSDIISEQFIELDERMYQLELFLTSIATHVKTNSDAEFINFLVDQEWPTKIKFQKTKGKIARIAERVNKHWLSNINFTNFESWFEETYDNLLRIEPKLNDLAQFTRSLHHQTFAIAREIEFFSSVCTNLCFAENFGGLASVFNKLASLKEQLASLHQDKAKYTVKYGVATVKHTHFLVLGLISIFKNAVLLSNEYNNLSSRLIVKNDELKQKEFVSTPRKITQYKQEIYDIETAKADCKKELDVLLENLKYEVEFFDKTRVKNAKKAILTYFKALYEIESKTKSLWEEFLPNCQLLEQPN